MSNDNSGRRSPNERRGSVTSAAFSNLFRRNSVSGSANGNGYGNGAGRESVSAAAARDQRRRLSVTTLGLSGGSPPSASVPYGLRRGSISTNNSDSIDESAIEDDEPAKVPSTSPFTRRTSFGAQAMLNMRGGQTSPGSGRPPQNASHTAAATPRQTPGASSYSAASARRMSTSQASNTLSARTPSDMTPARSENGYNWTEQLRYRAESSVSGQRPTFSSVSAAPSSPPRTNPQHDRANSVSDMPEPPRQPEVMKPRHHERPKPDHMQERILKGDFYMD
ncbi:hypothetical protein F4808DRAFT_221074 [Astrocystis sublimbata]|nr:hypothetical protein F4808DRAFT_221074 [Astrocystis sublimbata]